MLIRTYIEALLADEHLAEEVWTIWDRGIIDDGLATIAWLIIANST